MGRHTERLRVEGDTGGRMYGSVWEKSVSALARQTERNYPDAKRLGGKGSYPDNRQVTDEMGEESVANVMAVLTDKRLFPWIGEVEETQKWDDDDTRLKTDILVYPLDQVLDMMGFVDLWRVQVKSGWHELMGVDEHGAKLCGLTPKEWRELMLIVLVGQQTQESIAATFIIQIMNHLKIWGDEVMVKMFMGAQPQPLQRMVAHLLAQDLVGRDWDSILHYVRGNGAVKEQRVEGGKGMVRFY